MAPTTRSASKRAADPSVPPGAPGNSRALTNKRRKKGKQIFVNTDPPRCPLLEMPPEIRNRIYYFCKERAFDADWNIPRRLCRNGRTTNLPHLPEARTFFSVTQTCKAIRHEYRPLWLRQSSVQIDVDDIQCFLTTFYSQQGAGYSQYQDAPRLMIVAWDHTRKPYADSFALLDIKPLLKLRAYSASSTIKFMCRSLIDFDLDHRLCSICEQCITCTLDDEYDSDPETWSDHQCSHDDAVDDVFWELEQSYAYLDALNDFLGNNKEPWLEKVRAWDGDAMTVHCTMGEDCIVPTIYIRFTKGSAPLPLRTKHMYTTAAVYLTQMGIMDLRMRAGLDFVVGVATGKYMRPPVEAASIVATYNQTHICGRTFKGIPSHLNPNTGLRD